MLYKRISAVIPVLDDLVVQSIAFRSYLPVGKIENTVRFLNEWGVDEIILLDISKGRMEPNYRLLENASVYSRVPLTYGGGIKQLQQAKQVLESGADKISLNSLLFENSNTVREIANEFGNQVIVAAVDVIKNANDYYVYRTHNENQKQLSLLQHLQNVNVMGVGELLINSVDRDGNKQGYDIKLLELTRKNTELPMIVVGGAGVPEHFVKPFMELDIESCAAGNMLHFVEHSVNIIKSYLANQGIRVRLDNYYNYTRQTFDGQGRLLKRDEQLLDHLKFEIQVEEKI